MASASDHNRDKTHGRGGAPQHAAFPPAPASGMRVPPQSLDTERALLGALMINHEAMYEVADIIRQDSFYAGQHRSIYDAMLTLYEKGQSIDLITVSNRLKDLGQLSDVGGSAYLSELVASSSSPGSAKHYADIVQSKFILRSLLSVGWQISELGYSEDRAVEEILEEAEQAIFSVASAPSLRKFSVIKEELTEAWERLEHLQKHENAMRGVSTGFPELDSRLSGFQKSDLIILAARPSMGKTALALDIARKTAIKHGTAVGIFSLEMSSQQLTDRMLSAQSNVDSWKLRTGKIKKEEDFQRLQEGMAALSEAPIYIDDQPGATILSMRSIARRLKLEKSLQLIIVDYLQLITPAHSRGGDNLVQQITEISRSLKSMARELDVPVLALSQLSRAVEQRRGRPRLSDLRDSGSIEQDADVVMFIHRDDKMNADSGAEKTNIAEILIEKHRNGPTGKVDLRFDEEKTTFRSVEKSDFGDFISETEVEGGSPF
ncbi:MAG: replicative DNA helicase [Patescibacteria group bacterium]